MSNFISTLATVLNKFSFSLTLVQILSRFFYYLKLSVKLQIKLCKSVLRATVKNVLIRITQKGVLINNITL